MSDLFLVRSLCCIESISTTWYLYGIKSTVNSHIFTLVRFWNLALSLRRFMRWLNFTSLTGLLCVLSMPMFSMLNLRAHKRSISCNVSLWYTLWVRFKFLWTFLWWLNSFLLTGFLGILSMFMPYMLNFIKTKPPVSGHISIWLTFRLNICFTGRDIWVLTWSKTTL
jgi:hypothetical protein